jgi:hypothetical protein
MLINYRVSDRRVCSSSAESAPSFPQSLVSSLAEMPVQTRKLRSKVNGNSLLQAVSGLSREPTCLHDNLPSISDASKHPTSQVNIRAGRYLWALAGLQMSFLSVGKFACQPAAALASRHLTAATPCEFVSFRRCPYKYRAVMKPEASLVMRSPTPGMSCNPRIMSEGVNARNRRCSGCTRREVSQRAPFGALCGS